MNRQCVLIVLSKYRSMTLACMNSYCTCKMPFSCNIALESYHITGHTHTQHSTAQHSTAHTSTHTHKYTHTAQHTHTHTQAHMHTHSTARAQHAHTCTHTQTHSLSLSLSVSISLQQRIHTENLIICLSTKTVVFNRCFM